MSPPASSQTSPVFTDAPIPEELSQAERNPHERFVHELQSAEQAELLDAIDRLRREDIDADISIPQIVVCGDQSSGKSSLLEAIAQVPFPAGSGATTLFATEVVLRNAEQFDIKVSLEPDARRSVAEKQHLRDFNPTLQGMGREDFLRVHSDASRYLEDFEPDRGFWYDRLRAEISGPDQPHLTLVDLPGLIRTPTGKQRREDVDAIDKLAHSYLQNERTVVLAVVSAMSDFQVQLIGNLIRTAGPAQERMIGVITKPDGVLGKSDADKDDSSGTQSRTAIGPWLNLSHEESDRSPQRRDIDERRFFRSSIWSRIPPDDCCIGSLRQKLSQSLLSCIKRDMPVLVSEMESQLQQTQRTLEQLGQARETARDHRQYLTNIAVKLRELVGTALEGETPVENDLGFFDRSEAKKLRNIITKNTDAFGNAMRLYGRHYRVMVEADARGSIPRLPPQATLDFAPPFRSNLEVDQVTPYQVAFEHYCSQLATWMRENRGKDLPNLLKRGTLQAIFRQQSIYWEPMARAHVHSCRTAALELMRLAVTHVAGRHTGQKLMQAYVNPAFDAKYAKLEEKVAELMWPYQKCHLITDDPRWLSRTQAQATPGEDAEETNPQLPWSAYVASLPQCSKEHRIAADAMDRADVYYDIAIDTFIDNIATLAIERCLLSDLPDLVSSNDIAGLDDGELCAIGSEPPEAREERARALSQAAALDTVIKTCRRHSARSAPESTVHAPQIQPTDRLDQMLRGMKIAEHGTGPFATPTKKVEATGQGVLNNGLLTPMASAGRRTPSPTPVNSGKRRTIAEDRARKNMAEFTAGNMRRQSFGRPVSGGQHGMQPTVADDTEDDL